MVTVLAGTAGGLAACALSLQASGAWSPTETQGATVVAVAAVTASVATVQGAVDRYRSDIRWRRWRRLAISVIFALGSACAASGLALVAAQALRLGPAGRGALIGVAAVTALAGAVFGAYTDERTFGDKDRQKRLEGMTARLLAGAFEQIDIAPDDLEVILLLRARDLFHPKRRALRIVHTVCMGVSHEHPGVIHEPVAEPDDGDPIWKCYHDDEPVEPAAGRMLRTSKISGGFQLRLRSDSALGIWAAPVRNGTNDVVGVLAVQTYATFSARDPHGTVFLPGVGLTASILGGMILSDYQ